MCERLSQPFFVAEQFTGKKGVYDQGDAQELRRHLQWKGRRPARAGVPLRRGLGRGARKGQEHGGRVNRWPRKQVGSFFKPDNSSARAGPSLATTTRFRNIRRRG